MADHSIIDSVCQRVECDRQKLIDNELQKIEVDSFNLSEFWVEFGSAVQSLSNEVTKVGFMCGKKPYPSSGELQGMMNDLSQSYNVMRDLYLVLPEEVGKLVYKSTTDAVRNIMTTLIAVIKSLKDLSDTGAKERLTLTGTFWDACNAIDKLPKNNLEASIAAVEAEQCLINDAVEELNQVKESVTPENDMQKPKKSVREEIDESHQFQHKISDSESDTEANINLNAALQKKEKRNINKKGLMGIYSKAKFLKKRINKLTKPNLFNRKGGNKKSNLRNVAGSSNSNRSLSVSTGDSDTVEHAKPDSTESIPELDPDTARPSRGSASGCDSRSIDETHSDNEASSNVRAEETRRKRYRTISQSDYINLGQWVRTLRSWQVPVDASNLPGKLDEMINSLQKMANNWRDYVNLGIFEGLNEDQINEKELQLLKKLEDFRAIKVILERDPRALRVLFPGSEASTSRQTVESGENQVSSTSDCTVPTQNLVEDNIDPEPENGVSSTEPHTH